jgi:para-nitrobenzyl esterase
VLAEPVLAETAGGRLKGTRGGGVIAFRGVPYAVAARWRPPEVRAPWSGTRDAVSPGPACPQPDRAVARFAHGQLPAMGEDCLHLNLHTPSLTGSRPVLVWLHGGGFATGHAGSSMYDGARLAATADAVVVTISYRLGSLGFLCHPDLADGSDAPAGNWGLQDQIAALRWVRENVARFGGDPDRVSLAGQSAGALCALDLLVVPESEGLFSRLILHSPPLGDLALAPERAVLWAHALSREAGGAGEFDVAHLRTVPAAEIVAAHEAALARPEFQATRGALPTLDPASLPVSPRERPDARPEIPMLIGSTLEEGTFFFASPWRPAPPPERIAGIVRHLCPGQDASEVLERHRRAAALAGRPADPQALLVAVATEAMVAGPLREFARARAGAGRVFVFRVDHPGGTEGLGATHTVDVPLLFGTWHDGGAGQRLAGAAAGAGPVSEALMAAWGRFLHGEDPGWRGLGEGHEGIDEIGVFGGEQPYSIVPGDC